MRHPYNLSESYIGLPEFEDLAHLAKNNNVFEESLVTRAYHNFFGYKFGHAFDKAHCCYCEPQGVGPDAGVLLCLAIPVLALF